MLTFRYSAKPNKRKVLSWVIIQDKTHPNEKSDLWNNDMMKNYFAVKESTDSSVPGSSSEESEKVTDAIPTWLLVLENVIFTAFVPSGKLSDEIVKLVEVISVFV